MKLTLISVPLLLLAACGEKPRPVQPAAAAPVPVRAEAVSAQQWPAVYETSGTVHARAAAVVSSKVTGYVREVGFQLGDRVRQGQLLVALETRELDTGVERADAAIHAVATGMPEAENGIAAAKANLELAEVTYRRMQDLAAKKSISSQEFDEATAKVRSARANYEVALSKKEQLRARMRQAEEDRRAAVVMRDYARLHAPFAGVVTARSVEPGNLATPGAPLLTIERDGQYRLEASIEESKLAGARPGQPVEVVLDALGRSLAGRIAEVVPAVDAASRTYTVKIDLPAVPQLRSGTFGRALFPLGSRQVIAVPCQAVAERGQLQSVMVAEDGIARTRLITIGRRNNGACEVLSGLNAGEKVIAPVPAGLADGGRVEVRP